jgi:SynChlorMet cassette radical SAM/SPASM protein ScmE
MASPRSVDICITHKCNLRCSYCSYFSSAGDVDTDLPTEEWLTFFEELGRLGIMRLTLSGGEPFMRSDFTDLVDGIISNRMRFSVLSNGTLVTPQLALFLKETKRCDSVQVSIDGVDPESHDVFRGEGTLDRALKGLTFLLEAGVRATVRVTIHKRNFDQLERIAELLLDDIGLPSFSTNAASYMGLCRENKDTVALNAKEQTVAMEQLDELARRYPRRISAQAGPLANLKLWRKVENAQKEGLKELPGCGYLRSCGGVFTKIAVRADGIMVPCDQISHVELGRINRDDLTTVWHNHPELIRLRNRQEIPLGEFEFCGHCEYIPFCRGGCPALAYTITGSEDLPSPASCYRQFIADGGRLPE